MSKYSKKRFTKKMYNNKRITNTKGDAAKSRVIK